MPDSLPLLIANIGSDMRSAQGDDIESAPPIQEDGFSLRQAAYRGGSDASLAYILLLGLRSVYYNDAGKKAEVMSVLNGTSFHTITSPSALVPDILEIKKDGLAIYFIAGTTNIKQWISFYCLNGQVATAGCPGLLNQAFAEIAELCYPLIRDRVQLLPEIGGRRFFGLVGHSLGGALAEVLACKLKAVNNTAPNAVWTFGAPRVGERVWAERIFRAHTAWVLEDDPVPTVPPHIWTRRLEGALGVVGTVVPCRYDHTPCLRRTVGAHEIVNSYGGGGLLALSIGSIAYLASVVGFPQVHSCKAYAGLAIGLKGFANTFQKVMRQSKQDEINALHAFFDSTE